MFSNKKNKKTLEKNDFSLFFMHKKSSDKKKILEDVVRKANEDQRKIIQEYRKLKTI